MNLPSQLCSGRAAWSSGAFDGLGRQAGGRGTSLGGVIGAVEGLLQPRYQGSWRCALAVVQSLLNRLRADSHPLMKGAVKQLVGMVQRGKKLSPATHDALDAALGAAIVNLGPERLLEAYPIFADAAAPSLTAPNNAWLLPALKRHVRGARLDFFTQSLLPLADRLREAAVAAESAGRPVEAKNLMLSSPMEILEGQLELEARAMARVTASEDAWNAMRAGMFALITPVMTSTDGRCVATMQ